MVINFYCTQIKEDNIMLHNYCELILKLNGRHSRFDMLFEKYNQLDCKIKRIEEKNNVNVRDIVSMKIERLNIKRELQKILEEESKKDDEKLVHQLPTMGN